MTSAVRIIRSGVVLVQNLETYSNERSRVESTCFARENPFAMHLVEQIPFRFAAGCWGENLQRLEQQSFCGAIVGPHGSGKTTLLFELKQQLQNTIGQDRKIQYVLIDEDTRIRRNQIQEIVAHSVEKPVLLIDGSERASWLQRKKLFGLASRSVGVDSVGAVSVGIIAAVHKSCQLRTWVECSTDLQLMLSLIHI